MQSAFTQWGIAQGDPVLRRPRRRPSMACSLTRAPREPQASSGVSPSSATSAAELEMTHAADLVLVRAALTGDARATREIWRRFAPLVHRIVHRGMGWDYDVEDIVQSIFLTFFAKLPALRDPEALRSFLVSISARTVRYELRRRRTRRLMVLSPSPDLMEACAVSPDMDSRHTLHRVHVLLDRLSARERKAFVLRFVHGLELEETAEALKLSIPTIRRTLSRACIRLSILARGDGFLLRTWAGFTRVPEDGSATPPEEK
jgi:RNA polymerase sigma-70 factor (ECF subfamily)